MLNEESVLRWGEAWTMWYDRRRLHVHWVLTHWWKLIDSVGVFVLVTVCRIGMAFYTPTHPRCRHVGGYLCIHPSCLWRICHLSCDRYPTNHWLRQCDLAFLGESMAICMYSVYIRMCKRHIELIERLLHHVLMLVVIESSAVCHKHHTCCA